MNIGGLCLEKPVMNASGTLSKESLEEVKDIYGALVTKTVTLEPRTGNPPPRIAKVTGGMINSIGLQNPGIEEFLEEELDEWDVGLPVIVSVTEQAILDLLGVISRIRNDKRVAAVELNLSCPNVESLAGVLNPVRACKMSLRRKKPLIVKLSIENYAINAVAAQKAGADALTLINSIPSMTFLNGKPFLGGQSGPGIKGIALRAVHEVSQVVNLPLIGCGGTSNSEDIEEFFEVGASAVQIGSGSFVRGPEEIVATEKRPR